MQKILQLPFHIPTWKVDDVKKMVTQIMEVGLRDSENEKEFDENKDLIIKASEPNPRRVASPFCDLLITQLLLFRFFHCPWYW